MITDNCSVIWPHKHETIRFVGGVGWVWEWIAECPANGFSTVNPGFRCAGHVQQCIPVEREATIFRTVVTSFNELGIPPEFVNVSSGSYSLAVEGRR